METTILTQPSYSALKCTLKQGEQIHAESGALLAMSETATIEASMKGGLWKAIKRTALTSESFFVSTITASQNDTEVFLAPRATGDIAEVAMSGDEYLVQGGSFLASETGVQTDSKFTGFKGFLSGEGIFMIKASGNGKMFLSSFGGIIGKELRAGEKFIVDNGHIVAFPAAMPYEINTVGSGVVSSITTGEGLAITLQGPGTVLMQTRNLRTFAETLNPFLRIRERSQGKGLLGQVMGG